MFRYLFPIKYKVIVIETEGFRFNQVFKWMWHNEGIVQIDIEWYPLHKSHDRAENTVTVTIQNINISTNKKQVLEIEK